MLLNEHMLLRDSCCPRPQKGIGGRQQNHFAHSVSAQSQVSLEVASLQRLCPASDAKPP